MMTAYHEAGHALVARMLPNADPVRKVSIVARGMMGGYTRVVPDEDRLFKTKAQFEDELAVFMAGHVAEMMVFEEQSTGAANDIERATAMARRMVTEFGMSRTLGPLAFGKKEELVFLGREISEQRNYSDEVAFQIDQEIRELIDAAHARAKEVLTEQRRQAGGDRAAADHARRRSRARSSRRCSTRRGRSPIWSGRRPGDRRRGSVMPPAADQRPAARAERELPPSGAGQLRPQPAG